MRGRDRINACLPDELIADIFQRIESKTGRDACSLVCKRWFRLDRFTRRSLRFGASGGDRPDIPLLAAQFPNVTSVYVDERLSGSRPGPFERRLRSDQSLLSSRRGHLRSKSIVYGKAEFESYCLSDSALTALGEGFVKLEKLSLIWCSSVTCVGVKSIAEKLKSLKFLNLQACYVGDQGLAAVGESCKQLEELNLRFCEGLTDTGLMKLAFGCGKSLKTLGIAACAKITDVSLEAVGSHCVFLESFSLDSELINDKGVLAVVRGCRLLKKLNLHCSNLTDVALQAVGTFSSSLDLLALSSFDRFTDMGLCAIGRGCKKLRSLTISDCYSFGDKGLESIAIGCSGLAYLEVNGCKVGTSGIKSIGKYCLHLSELVLSYCQGFSYGAFSEVGVGCKFLQALHLLDCSSFGDDDLCSIAKGCKHLKKLHLRRCYEIRNRGMSAVGKHCRSLTDLSIQFCNGVGDMALRSVAHGCSLRNLNVSGCDSIGDAGITEVARECSGLTYLDVSVLKDLGDTALLEIGEGCPLLKGIVLSHCCGVTDVGLSYLAKKCLLLESCHIAYCPGITSAGVATMVSSCASINNIVVEKFKVSERTKRQAGSVISYLCVDLDD